MRRDLRRDLRREFPSLTAIRSASGSHGTLFGSCPRGLERSAAWHTLEPEVRMAVAERRGEVLMTAEELLRRPDLNPCELVDGHVVPMSPTGYRHGEIESDIVVALKEYGRRTGRGRVAAGEVGIIIRRPQM